MVCAVFIQHVLTITSAIEPKHLSEEIGSKPAASIDSLWLALAEGMGDGIVGHSGEAVTGVICNNQS
jgi:hypothetical protein